MPSRREILGWIGGISAGIAVPVILGLGSKRNQSFTLSLSPTSTPSQMPEDSASSTTPHTHSNDRSTTPNAPQETPSSHTTNATQPQVKIPVRHLQIRRSAERGHFDFGWLQTHHSFSFGRYWDPKHMGFRALRVINEDWIRPSMGFPMHPHRDMEIITYILSGALQHRDSIGNGSVIRPGEIQRMSAGRGIRHSEFNPSGLESVHLLQIWLLPDRQGHTPSYAQQLIPQISTPDPVRLIASPDGQLGSITLHQDVRLYACHLANQQQMHFEVRPQRHAWVQIAHGNLTVNGQVLRAGDGFSTSDNGWIMAYANEASELLLFDLA